MIKLIQERKALWRNFMSVNSNMALGNQGDSFSQNFSSIQATPKLTGGALKEKNRQLDSALYLSKDFQKAIELIKEGAEISSLTHSDPPPLIHAIREGNQYEFIKFLIESNVNPNHTSYATGSALCAAVSMRQNEIAKLLIKSKADLDITEGYTGNTPLHLAIESENNEMAKLLIDNNANLNIQNKSKVTPLEMAISRENNEVAKYLIDKPATDLTIQDDFFGDTPLCQAILKLNSELATYLINRMTDAALNIPNTRGRTPFHLAVEGEQREIAKLLIERKVDLNTKDCSGQTPLMSAIAHNDNELALLLIKNGVDLDAQSNEKFGPNTALFMALSKSNDELVTRLVESGANVHIIDQHRLTPLDAAYARGNNPLIMLLIAKGCKHQSFPELGYLPNAILKKNNELARLLIENKLDLNTSYYIYGTPLMAAIHYKNDEIAKLLIENVPESINTLHRGNTPLIEALQSENPELARLLIEKGANPNIKDRSIRIQPLILAALSGYSEIVELLIEKKALFTSQQPELLLELNELLIRVAKYEDPNIRGFIVDKMHDLSEFDTLPALKMIKKAIDCEVSSLLSVKEKKLSSQSGRLKKAISRCERSIKEEQDNIAEIKKTIAKKTLGVLLFDDTEVESLTLELKKKEEKIESLKELKMRKEEEIQNAQEIAARPIDRKELKLRAAIPLFLVGLMERGSLMERCFLTERGSDKPSLDFIFDTLTKKINLKNIYIHRTIVTSIYNLYSCGINKNTKINILRKILDTPDKELKGLSMVALLAKFEESSILRDFIETKQDPILFLKDAVSKLLRSKFNLDGVKDIDDKYTSTFKRFRNPEAIFMYAATLKKHSTDSEKAGELLSMYVRDILEGRFETERYNLDNSEHLRKVFEGDSGKALLEKWMEGEVVSPDTLVSNLEVSGPSAIDYLKVFREKIVSDNHLGVDWNEKYSYLSKAFTSENGLDDVLDEISNLLPTLKDSDLRVARAQQQILLLCNNKELSKEDQTELLKSIGTSFSDEELKNDIRALLIGLEKEKNKPNKTVNYTVCDTDDPCDIILMGHEIFGSCQRLDGNASLNIGLLGPLLDGKYRLIVVKDEAGKLVARCLVKILWDENKGVPVLFQERFYINAASKDVHAKLLGEMCIRKAKKMNLALVKSRELQSKAPAYNNPMVSLDGRSDFEYVDALDGIQGNRYEIPSGTVIWQPEK
jgi:ankyrin repeat protein